MAQGADMAAGLYIHIPYCVSKCAYCAFNSLPLAGGDPGPYLQALDVQLRRLAAHPLAGKNIFSTIFIGGGTPTIYGGEQLAGIVSAALAHFQFSSQPEITVETNPNSHYLGRVISNGQAEEDTGTPTSISGVSRK